MEQHNTSKIAIAQVVTGNNILDVDIIQSEWNVYAPFLHPLIGRRLSRRTSQKQTNSNTRHSGGGLAISYPSRLGDSGVFCLTFPAEEIHRRACAFVLIAFRRATSLCTTLCVLDVVLYQSSMTAPATFFLFTEAQLGFSMVSPPLRSHFNSHTTVVITLQFLIALVLVARQWVHSGRKSFRGSLHHLSYFEACDSGIILAILLTICPSPHTAHLIPHPYTHLLLLRAPTIIHINPLEKTKIPLLATYLLRNVGGSLVPLLHLQG